MNGQRSENSKFFVFYMMIKSFKENLLNPTTMIESDRSVMGLLRIERYLNPTES